jgi:hypothetical protein
MNAIRNKFTASPSSARIAPYFIFLALTFGQSLPFPDARYAFYALKTLVGIWLVWELCRVATEVRWAFSWEAVAVGIAIFGIWVGIDPYVPKNHIFFKPTPDDVWNPFVQHGEGSVLAWFYVSVRILGSTLVVPPLEEAFFRSFLYRWLVKVDFLKLPLSFRHTWSWVATSLVFGFVHYEWLAGILCGLAYQWLVLRKGRLGDAMTAHAITNFILGVYIVWKGAWGFW